MYKSSKKHLNIQGNELFHTINELKQMNKKVILSGATSPFLIDGLSRNLVNEIASNLTISAINNLTNRNVGK